MTAFITLALLTAAVASCVAPGSYSNEFKKESAALARPPLAAEGPWVGRWKSNANGHEGPIWCLVHPSPGRPGHYDFRYRAGWGAFRFGDYTHTAPARRTANGGIEWDGAMELPGGFGTYRVEGRLTPTAFDATYRSAADHGTMTLRRPD